MGLKDLCCCTNSHHPFGPSTTLSTQLICTNLEHKPLSLFQPHTPQRRQNGKNKHAVANSNTIYPRSTWQTTVQIVLCTLTIPNLALINSSFHLNAFLLATSSESRIASNICTVFSGAGVYPWGSGVFINFLL